MTRIFLMFVSTLVLFGCARKTHLHEFLVKPGIGIENLCQVGMELSDVDNLHYITGPADKAISTKSEFGIVSTMGAVIYIENHKPIKLIEFHVQPYSNIFIPSFTLTNYFKGKVEPGLLFKGDPVPITEVYRCFGFVEPDTNFSFSPYRHTKGSFAIKKNNEYEEIWYMDKGIAFVLSSNVVRSFKIFKNK